MLLVTRLNQLTVEHYVDYQLSAFAENSTSVIINGGVKYTFVQW